MPILRALVPDDVWPRLETEYDEMMRGDKESVIGQARGIRKDGQPYNKIVTNWLKILGSRHVGFLLGSPVQVFDRVVSEQRADAEKLRQAADADMAAELGAATDRSTDRPTGTRRRHADEDREAVSRDWE